MRNSLVVRGAKHLRFLIESVNDGWNDAIPITKPRPQPDYFVGFQTPGIYGGPTEETSAVCRRTYSHLLHGDMVHVLPLLLGRSEVRVRPPSMVADRQNAHNMTLAVRGVVTLFRPGKREKELHREILAFSVSHDNRSVRIYGHYPVFEGKRSTFYRHSIHEEEPVSNNTHILFRHLSHCQLKLSPSSIRVNLFSRRPYGHAHNESLSRWLTQLAPRSPCHYPFV
ncbi:hypothetical protein, variant [Exophiala xenobiotica]|uniref:DUF7924 domain-containing protein n=1 Tax=Exophiala xenobiotica TaxID=348802 RepID=A0A0D2E936_9EURO|nr:hypothetical protein, variant [Exophiala xenobiotica]XP_013311765.1 uncharacterized protein PV05_09924 [Exophiala xenobiotica]KIW51180.1 hypothetical protein PV05_09924 [Exophiala xenobiotica]KIW51181.1 hypothetical protein, variant [Exophiala xenobiotica]